MKKTNFKQSFLNFSISFLILSYFLFKVDLQPITENFVKLNITYFVLSLIIFFPNTFLYIYKWHLVVQKFNKEKFLLTYKKISKSILFSELLQSSFFLDLSKFFYLKKIEPSKKISLLINEKILTISIKIFYVLILFFLIKFFLNFQFLFFENNIIFVSTISIILLLSLSLIFFLKRIKFFKNYYKNFLSEKIINKKRIFVIELIRNFLMSFIYFFSFLNIYDFQTAIFFAIISPFIEIILRFQFMSSIGFREFIFYFIGSKYGYDSTIILPSIFISIVTFLTTFNNFIFSKLLNENSKKNKKLNNVLVYIKNNNTKGSEDFLQQLNYFIKLSKDNSISNNLSFNYKKVFFIENFVNPIEFLKIFFFLLLFRGKKILICTEFITSNNGNYSFNDFDKENNYGYIKCFCMYFFYKIISEKIFNFKLSIKKKRIIYLSYFKFRYLSAKLLTSFFDSYILGHPNMRNSFNVKKNILDFPYVFPKIKIPYNLNNKKFQLDFSGYLTPYRLGVLKNLRINKNIFDDRQIKEIAQDKNLNNFIVSKKKKSFTFSLNIEKEKKWKHSSPARYFNNLKKNQVPIIFKSFNDKFDCVTLNKEILSMKSKKKILKKINSMNLKIELYQKKKYQDDISKLINS